MKIDLYKLFCTDTLRHRETARKIVENVISENRDEPQIMVDFDKIEFASHSFLHELLSYLNDREIMFVNANKEITMMSQVILKKLESTPRLSTECGVLTVTR